MKGFVDLGFAKVDINRPSRCGLPEVIYCPGKTPGQIKLIGRQILKSSSLLVLTRLDKKSYLQLKKTFRGLKFVPRAHLAYLVKKKIAPLKKGTVLVMTAGTSDIPVAEEAAAILKILGNNVLSLYDVGVAGVHRLFDHIGIIRKASVIIVIAGMEGALASLVSGLVKTPVIAVPTSCGYGANFEGLSALLTMLNCCAPGVVVVNIDNGFGAGYFASLINR